MERDVDYVVMQPKQAKASRLGTHHLVAAFLAGAAASTIFRSAPVVVSVAQADGVIASCHRPHKFAVDGTTPVELQLARGTCWIFSAVDVLEWTYRAQGVAQGWLEQHDYVRMSEQAFGIAVLEACMQLPNNQSCDVGNAEVWRGRQLMPSDTDGGDANLLFYLKSLQQTAALPWSVCPYTSEPGHDHECRGLGEARSTNPLGFTMRSITWLYEREAVKARMLKQQRLMTFSTNMARRMSRSRQRPAARSI